MDKDRKHSALLLADMIAQDPTLLEKISKNPKAELEALAHKAIAEKENPLVWDKWIYRSVVTILGLTILMVIGGTIYLSAQQVQHLTANGVFRIPEILTAIGSAAVGALAGLLAPSPTSKT